MLVRVRGSWATGVPQTPSWGHVNTSLVTHTILLLVKDMIMNITKIIQHTEL